MQRIHSFVLRISKWPVWLFFFVAFAVFAGYVMNQAATDVRAVCDAETKIPDTEIGYTPDDLRAMLPYLTGACGEAFRHVALVLDSFFPLAYGGLLFFSIVFLYYKGRGPFAYRGLYVFAPLAMLFDYGENSTLAYLVKQNGNYPEACLTWASVFSGLKWLFVFICMGLIVVGIIRWLMLRYRNG